MTRRFLFLDPFHGGSHAAFADAITRGVDADWTLATLPARHWKWRMRGAGLWLREKLDDTRYDLVVATSMFPLGELAGLCPSLRDTPTLLYFHENQLAYPVRSEHASERDQHFAFTQITAAAAADGCAFNSEYNRDSFFDGIERVLGRMPDARPRGLVDELRDKSRVLPVPIDLPDPGEITDPPGDRAEGPIVLWNHRWEHDKRPDRFFDALRALAREDVPFRLAVCGEQFRERPAEFAAAQRDLASRIVHWGFVEDRSRYAELLRRAHLAVSTSDHEFFGVSMLEAVHAGAAPLVPDRLSYPELYPAEYRYGEGELPTRLAALCRAWTAGEISLRADRTEHTAPFAADRVLPSFASWFQEYSRRNVS
ncbi:MAG: DUF3524 domain-containing protein [Planctomycetes bacterium]|nr:DUF3524 domain-containing protein [Planctomycetota bacterium]